MNLPTLPIELLESIVKELSASSQLCLRYTYSALFWAPCVPQSETIIHYDSFIADPMQVREERALFLAYLESDGFQLFKSSSWTTWLSWSLSAGDRLLSHE